MLLRTLRPLFALRPRRVVLGGLILLAAPSAAASQAAPPADPEPPAWRDADGGRLAARTPAAPPLITTQPVLTASPRVPLAATIALQTSVPTRIALEVDDGVRRFLIPNAEPNYRRQHSVPVLGLRAERTHRIWVLATDRAGRRTVAPGPLVFSTPPLPPDFPPLNVKKAQIARMEPGYTLLGVRQGGTSGTLRYLMVLDLAGDVVWYLEGSPYASPTSAGTLLAHTTRNVVQEVDMLGDVVHEWYATGLSSSPPAPPDVAVVPTDSFHHEFSEVHENDETTYLTLSSELRTYPNYPAEENAPWKTVPSADVVGDVIVEFERDGTIVREKRLLDVLDPYRIGYDSLTLSYWHSIYGTAALDWSHANSVVLDEDGDAYIVSVRHQDAIVKIRRHTSGTGTPDDLVWILGNPDAWSSPWKERLLDAPPFSLPPRQPQTTGPPLALGSLGPDVPRLPGLQLRGPAAFPFEWPYHQHAAVLTPSGNLVCFDNGNYRATPPEPYAPDTTWYSRAVEYRIRPGQGEVEQVWAAGGIGDPNLYRIGFSRFVSNAEPQPLTGNVLVNGGGTIDFASRTTYTRILELRRTQPAETVMELEIRDPDALVSWVTYRAHRIPDVYPTPSPETLSLSAGRIVAGRSALLRATGAPPGTTLLFSMQRLQGGAGDAEQELGRAVVGADGSASLTAQGPPLSAAGESLELRALVLGHEAAAHRTARLSVKVETERSSPRELALRGSRR